MAVKVLLTWFWSFSVRNWILNFSMLPSEVFQVIIKKKNVQIKLPYATIWLPLLLMQWWKVLLVAPLQGCCKLHACNSLLVKLTVYSYFFTATTGVLLKKGALKNFANFAGKHLCVFSCEICKIFKNTYFVENLRTAASVLCD